MATSRSVFLIGIVDDVQMGTLQNQHVKNVRKTMLHPSLPICVTQRHSVSYIIHQHLPHFT